MNFQKIKEQDQKNILNTYHRFDLCIESGRGATCKDVNGKTYIDFTSGIGVNSLGFAHPEWVKAVTGQAAKLAHISNLYYTIPDNELAKALCEQTGYGAVFFGNSGAEAMKARSRSPANTALTSTARDAARSSPSSIPSTAGR